MELIADVLLVAAAFGAALYCYVLSRRLRRLGTLESGMGGAIAVLSAQVDDMTRALESAQSAARQSAAQLEQLTRRAEGSAQRLELMIASLHDLPEPARDDQPAAELRPVAAVDPRAFGMGPGLEAEGRGSQPQARPAAPPMSPPMSRPVAEVLRVASAPMPGHGREPSHPIRPDEDAMSQPQPQPASAQSTVAQSTVAQSTAAPSTAAPSAPVVSAAAADLGALRARQVAARAQRLVNGLRATGREPAPGHSSDRAGPADDHGERTAPLSTSRRFVLQRRRPLQPSHEIAQ